MLRVFRRYHRALSTYIDTCLAMGPICDRCACDYLYVHSHRTDANGDSGELFSGTVRRYLGMLVDRRIVSVGPLAPVLVEYLAGIAREAGYLPAHEESEPGAAGESGTGADGRHLDPAGTRETALVVLGLDARSTPREIRMRYRELMRAYHPDVNPDGLEKSKEINAAYGVLSGG